MSQYCRGCYSFIHSDADNYCTYLRYNDTGKCPCCTCVVKVMCSDPCSKFLNFKTDLESLRRLTDG